MWFLPASSSSASSSCSVSDSSDDVRMGCRSPATEYSEVNGIPKPQDRLRRRAYNRLVGKGLTHGPSRARGTDDTGRRRREQSRGPRAIAMASKSFYIIDGHAHIYRAYFAPFR